MSAGALRRANGFIFDMRSISSGGLSVEEQRSGGGARRDGVYGDRATHATLTLFDHGHAPAVQQKVLMSDCGCRDDAEEQREVIVEPNPSANSSRVEVIRTRPSPLPSLQSDFRALGNRTFPSDQPATSKDLTRDRRPGSCLRETQS